MSEGNEYLEQVQQQAVEFDQNMKMKRKKPMIQMNNMNNMNIPLPVQESFSLEQTSTKEPNHASSIRITGWGKWKTVVVPPNMYVVHTRRGHKKPLNMGLGISFKFNPYQDSFLTVPSAMQTILINANSICKELQGILIQAYVQWIIDDVEVAYQRLDFSDMEDPMGVVNLQLKEQAEAAIKDKVSTLSIKEVLSDKQPIIKELTKRLKEVAEGSSDDKGLGIRIVTVQIKEAIVSSTGLWENLQKPFRAAQNTAARLAEIENEALISSRELEEQQKQSKETLEIEGEIKAIKAKKEGEIFARTQEENLKRHHIEQEAQRTKSQENQETERLSWEGQQKNREQKISIENQLNLLEKEKEFEKNKKKIELEMRSFELEKEKLQSYMALEVDKMKQNMEYDRQKLDNANQIQMEKLKSEMERKRLLFSLNSEEMEKKLVFEEKSQKIANMVSPELIQLRATELLPEIAATLPTPDQLQSIQIGGINSDTTSLVGLFSSLITLLKQNGVTLSKKKTLAVEEKDCEK